MSLILSRTSNFLQDYKKPLEEASPSILSSEKIRRLFHKLPEILQCHTLFRIGLSEAVANWDRDHKIGDVFVASFSKSIVLEIYSEFINNFSAAMDVARGESKKKPALAEFFKVSVTTVRRTIKIKFTKLSLLIYPNFLPIRKYSESKGNIRECLGT